MIPVAQPAVVLDATWQVPYLRSIWGCWRAGFTHFLRRNIPNANVHERLQQRAVGGEK